MMYSPRKLTPNSNLSNKQPYFSHHRNSMYMGGFTVFAKNGTGLVLHDNGSCVISSYYNDMLHGYNTFLLADGNIASVQFNKNKFVEAVYRSKKFLLHIKYNNVNVPDGTAFVVDYMTKQVINVKFKNGQIINKNFETDESKLTNIFQVQNLTNLLPYKHYKNINLEFDQIETIKQGQKLTIGYFKNGFLNGLGIVLYMSTNQQMFQLAEKGYYKNSQLNGLGERRFKDGNIYIGEFKNDQFEGQGILKNQYKRNWVFGRFNGGTLIELLNHDAEGNVEATKQIYHIHKKKSSWINKDIFVLMSQFFEKDITKILESKIGNQSLEDRKQSALKKIQKNFTSLPISQELSASNLKLPQYMKSHEISRFVLNPLKKSAIEELMIDSSKLRRSHIISPNDQDFILKVKPVEMQEQSNRYKTQVEYLPIDRKSFSGFNTAEVNQSLNTSRMMDTYRKSLKRSLF